MSLKDLLKNTVAAGLKRQSITSPSRWAEEYRVMGPPVSGKWRFEVTPWTRAMHDSDAPVNIGQKSAQMGFTETVLNITFYRIDIKNESCLYILPTKTPDATEFSAARFDAALELSDHLGNLFSNVKNVGHKRAGSANLYVGGANSRSFLKSKPVVFIVFDELDEMKQENIPLAEERASFQAEPQIWKISTPTIPKKRINGYFLDTTQEHYFFKCPSCSRYTEIIFPDSLIITADSKNDIKIKNSHIICTLCNTKLQHEDKKYFLKDGIWQPTADPQNERRGFYINQLYSVNRKPHEIAEMFFDAQIDKAKEQEFWNSKGGLPHIVEGAQVNDIEIIRCLGSYPKATVSPENTIITMGVDQGRWLHYEICAWDFPSLGNDLNMIAKPKVLTMGKCVDFNELDVLMKQYQIMAAVVDAQPDRRMAYEFACRFWGHVKLCFYAQGQSVKTITIDPDPDQHKIVVDRTSWLDTALNRFHIDTITLPRDTTEEYKDHLKNIVRHYREDSKGNPVAEYITTGADHFAHARCYAELALPLAASLTTNKNIKVFL